MTEPHDSGVADASDVSPKLALDFTKGGQPIKVSACDSHGHVTHVAATIASKGKGSSGQCRGIATAVSILSLKVLDANGAGSTSAGRR